VRVLIDTTYAERAPFSGTGVYLRRLCAELERRADVEVVRAVNRRRRPPAGGGMGSVRNLAADVRWTGFELPRLAARQRAEVIHHPLPGWAPLAHLPQVVTIHDLAFERLPDCFDRRFRVYARLCHRAAARAADVVVTVSATTASEARALWGLDPARIVVAPLGAGQELELPRRERGRAWRTHFLYVGDDEPRKSLGTLLAAYELYRERTPTPLPLILAGSAEARMAGVEVEERPTGRRLAELYAGAVALIQPSLYEGFGLTALEAMNAGTPVVAARSPGLLEVCGEAAMWAQPEDPESFAAAMLELAADPAVGERLAAAGRARAQRFSWARCAEEHVRAYSLAVTRA
jgi:glycosyltransferase involved in cell wall biosynthesis